jgi:hypothetical protein
MQRNIGSSGGEAWNLYRVMVGKALEKLRSRSSDNIKKDILGRKAVRI